MTKGQEVVKKGKQEVAQPTTPPRGFEHEDSSDLLLPRIELLQGLSPAVQQGMKVEVSNIRPRIELTRALLKILSGDLTAKNLPVLPT
jgi:hypothetical protein